MINRADEEAELSTFVKELKEAYFPHFKIDKNRLTFDMEQLGV